jgi:hypothetical protein
VTWPSAFAAGTLGYLKDRIADEIARDDLTTQIAAAVGDAIAIYQKERFRFSETRDVTWNTVIGQEFYTAADNPVIASHYYIDYLVAFIGGIASDLHQYTPDELELLAQDPVQSGTPEGFAFYNEQIRLYPVPAAVYPMRMGAHVLVAAPATDSTAGNRWMTDAERLIRARAKYQIAVNITLDIDEIAINSPDPASPGGKPGQAWLALRELRGEANRVTSTGGIVKAMNL